MLLYPFWVLLLGAVSVFAVARYTRRSGTTLFVCLLFLVNAMSVLVAFARFTEPASVALLKGLLLFEVSRLSVLASFVVLVIFGVGAIIYVPLMQEGNIAQGSTSLLLAAFCAVGSVLSKDPLSFAILLGGVPLRVFVRARLEKGFSGSPQVYLLYFIPSVMLILFAAVARGTAPVSGLGPISKGAALLLSVILAAYLLFWPFGGPSIRLLPFGRNAAPLAVSVIAAVAFFGLVKFLPHSTMLGLAMVSLGAVSAIAWTIMCYRSKAPVSTAQHGYFAQTSAVCVMIACALSAKADSSGEWFLILSNHLIAGFGMLLSASWGEERRGRYLHVAAIFFAFCFLGLPPSPGFFGRLHLFLGSFGDHTLFGYLLRLSFLVNLFLVYCLPKSLAAASRDAETASKTPWWVVCPLGVLAAALLLSMLFLPHLRAYLAASGL